MITELVYGPVQSRRLGLSLGINILGPVKLCSYDCGYCDLGPSEVRLNQLKKSDAFPAPAEIEEALRKRLRELKQENLKPDHLTLSGNGEPTLHTDYAEVVQKILQVRQDFLPTTKVVALSNGAQLDNKKVVMGLNLLDERLIKFDAGSDQMLKRINGPLVRTNVARLLSGIRKLKDVVLQSMFVQGAVNNATSEHLEEWVEAVAMVAPKAVHICGLNRPTVDPRITPVDEDTLYTVASKLKRRCETEILVFP